MDEGREDVADGRARGRWSGDDRADDADPAAAERGDAEARAIALADLRELAAELEGLDLSRFEPGPAFDPSWGAAGDEGRRP